MACYELIFTVVVQLRFYYSGRKLNNLFVFNLWYVFVLFRYVWFVIFVIRKLESTPMLAEFVDLC